MTLPWLRQKGPRQKAVNGKPVSSRIPRVCGECGDFKMTEPVGDPFRLTLYVCERCRLRLWVNMGTEEEPEWWRINYSGTGTHIP